MSVDNSSTLSMEDAASLERLLERIREDRGFDFTGYKRTSVARRIRRRLQTVGVDGFDGYSTFLESHPDEYTELFNTILINVTAFFRDTAAWDFLRSEIIPQIIMAREPREPIRVWCAGCSTGEEAYAVAIAFAEELGLEGLHDRVKIYATDVDTAALQEARMARYSPRQVEGLQPEHLSRYFEQVGSRYVVDRELRRTVIFGEHDLTRDPPISRIDLLLCRNTLMYFTPSTQDAVLAGFHFALRDQGYLFLGKAEMLLAHSALFRPVDMKWRVFQRLPRADMRERLMNLIPNSTDPPRRSPDGREHDRLRSSAFENNPVPEILLDVKGNIVGANEQARRTFGVALRDLGRPFQELPLSYRPVELRPAIDQVYHQQLPVKVANVNWQQREDAVSRLDVELYPLMADHQVILGVAIRFVDVSNFVILNETLQRSKEALEMALEELQATVEELETTNEELQSTNEELETTNEELQSTNEELETMNEELQSTNEELETMNEELRRRTNELNEVNAFMESIVSSVMMAVVVVDRDLKIHVWSRRAEDMWGIRSDEALGMHLLNLDIGLPLDQLRQPVRACLSGEASVAELALNAVNRRGRTISVLVTFSPLNGADGAIRGAVIMMRDQGEARNNETE